MDVALLAVLQGLTYINSVQTLDIVERTFQEWWMIGMDGERESGNSMLPSWFDDDDDDDDLKLFDHF